jgi:hypothetical protein
MRQFIARHKIVTAFVSGAMTVLILSGTGLAIAAIPGAKTYNACVNKKTGVVRILGVQAGKLGKKCAKTEKAVQWSAGAKGATGLQGPKGDQGLQGNANVSTTIVTLASSDFAYNFINVFWFSTGPGSASGYTSRYHDIAVPAITQSVLDTGSVQVAFTPSTGQAAVDPWSPLPFTFSMGGITYNYAVEVSLGKVRIHFFFAPLSGSTPDLSTYNMPTLKYKVTVIGGG